MKSSKQYSNKAIKQLHEFVETFIAENTNDIQALDGFLSALEDECQSVSNFVDALDNAECSKDELYEEEWEAHHHD